MQHPKADVDRLYIRRNKGERGMIQHELSYKTSYCTQRNKKAHSISYKVTSLNNN